MLSKQAHIKISRRKVDGQEKTGEEKSPQPQVVYEAKI